MRGVHCCLIYNVKVHRLFVLNYQMRSKLRKPRKWECESISSASDDLLQQNSMKQDANKAIEQVKIMKPENIQAEDEGDQQKDETPNKEHNQEDIQHDRVEQKDKIADIDISTPIRVDIPNPNALLPYCLSSQTVCGREEQLQKIKRFLLSHSIRILYICGTPGTGKTLCVKQCLKGHSHKYINCMATDQIEKVTKIAQKIEKIIVLDEFDLLLNGRQSLMCIRHRNSFCKIIVICNYNSISNQLHGLHQPIQTLFFLPYSDQQLKKIILDKLGTQELPQIVIKAGIKRAAQKSGDFRVLEKHVSQWSREYCLQMLHEGQKKKTRGLVKENKILENFIWSNTVLINKFLLTLISLQRLHPSNTSKCSCSHLTLDRVLNQREIKQKLSEEESEFYLQEWSEMGLLEYKRKQCRVHRCWSTSIALTLDEEEAYRVLKQYFYRHAE